MKRLVAVLVLFTALRAFAQAPVIRAHLEPASNIMVGQPVRLVVSVFVPNYFTGSPEFPEFEIENAIVVLPQDRPQNSNTQIGSTTYFGITQTYIIYPQQAGEFPIPPAKISVPYAIAPPKSIIAEAALPPLSFHADVPATARQLPYFLPTTRLTMTEHWSRPLKGLRTGDTVERTITITTSKMQAMLIPPLELEQPDGMRIYSGEPTVRDQKTSRGDFVYGQRIQTAKYFIQKPGNYTLPPIELKWWNLSTRKLEIAVLSETKFTAVVNPDYKAELPPPPEAAFTAPAPRNHPWPRYRGRARLVLQIALFIAFLLMLVRLGRQMLPHIVAWLKRRRNSEAACFRALEHAAHANDSHGAYARLLRWSAMTYPGMSLREVANVSSDAALSHEIDSLTASIYSAKGSATWNGPQLAALLQQLRSRSAKHRHADTSSHLQSLNPEPPRASRISL
ncbi:BatD family protein [Edaphobacter sp. HDX4]|uniref:BatD family protein n=1 Tax=Edaphobacter sp. HDX4 TaxID=2794064 RepID=UPI002FE53FB3